MPLLCRFDHFLFSRSEICQIFRWFFGKFKTPKRHSEMNWPLVGMFFYKKPPKTYLNLHHDPRVLICLLKFSGTILEYLFVSIEFKFWRPTKNIHIAFSYKPYYNTTVNYNNIKWSESEKKSCREIGFGFVCCWKITSTLNIYIRTASS